jgi:hypothetical protein
MNCEGSDIRVAIPTGGHTIQDFDTPAPFQDNLFFLSLSNLKL